MLSQEMNEGVLKLWVRVKYPLTETKVFAGMYRDKTMNDKLMYIPNDDKQNYHICDVSL